MAITRGQMSKQISKPPAKKKTKRKIPPKYLKGLYSADKAKRRKEIQRNAPNLSLAVLYRSSNAFSYSIILHLQGVLQDLVVEVNL